MTAQAYEPLFQGAPTAAAAAAAAASGQPYVQNTSDGRISTSLGHGFATWLLATGYKVYSWSETNIVGLLVGAVALYVIFGKDYSSTVQGRV